MTMSVGQTFPANSFARTDAEPDTDKEAQSGAAFADLLSTKAKPTGDGKKAALAKHEAAGSPPDAERVDDADLVSVIHLIGKKAAIAEKAEGQSANDSAAHEEQPQPRDKLPELISLQQLGALPAQPNQAPQVVRGKASNDTATRSAQSATASTLPLEEKPVSLDLRTSVTDRDSADRSIQPRILSDISRAPNETVATDVPGTTMPSRTKQGLPGLLDDGATAAKIAPEPRSAADKHAASGDFTVRGQQSFPAPAPQPISSTGAALVTALDSGLRQAPATHAAVLQQAQTVAVPTHILKIELHPAELGSVVASLRLSGQQLSVEIKPETHEAHRRLSADTEALTKSLRSLGFDIDSVKILQPSVAVTAAARADGTASMNPAGRDQSSFQPGGSDGRGDGSSGQQSGRNRNHDAQEAARSAPAVRERGSGDLFI